MASTASAQTEQNRPGTGGSSKPGIQGLPSGKWDTAVKSPNTTMPAPPPPESSGGSQAPGASKVSALPARHAAPHRGWSAGHQESAAVRTRARYRYARRQFGALIEIISLFLHQSAARMDGWGSLVWSAQVAEIRWFPIRPSSGKEKGRWFFQRPFSVPAAANRSASAPSMASMHVTVALSTGTRECRFTTAD
jgi:hypothetical protein